MDAPGGQDLSDFESGTGQPDLDLQSIIKPRSRDPRPQKPAETTETSQSTHEAAPDDAAVTENADPPAAPPQQRPATAAGGGSPQSDEQASNGGKSRRGRGRPRKPKSSESTGARRPSTVLIPMELSSAFERARDSQGLSNGDLIIAALEATGDQLADEIAKMGGRAGGGRFAARVTHQAAVKHEKGTLLNYRLFEADYEILDQMVAECNARSRNELIVTALRLHLSDTTSQR